MVGLRIGFGSSAMSIALITSQLIILLMYGRLAEAEGATEPVDEEMAAWSESLPESVAASQLEVRIDQGRALYEVCSACHLATGSGLPDGTMPQLAGQHRSVLIKQMVDIRSGRRRNPTMSPYLEPLEDSQDLADVAGYVEQLPISKQNGRGPGVGLDRGQKLYRESCASCHGRSGEGLAEAFYPRLQGQHYRYLVRQLIDIAGGRRGNSNPDMVAAIAGFSARDVAYVADYISRLPIPTRSGAKGTP